MVPWCEPCVVDGDACPFHLAVLPQAPLIGSGGKQQQQPSRVDAQPLAICVCIPSTALLPGCCTPADFLMSFQLAYLDTISSLPSASKNQGESTLPSQCPLAISWNADGPCPFSWMPCDCGQKGSTSSWVPTSIPGLGAYMELG